MPDTLAKESTEYGTLNGQTHKHQTEEAKLEGVDVQHTGPYHAALRRRTQRARNTMHAVRLRLHGVQLARLAAGKRQCRLPLAQE